MRYRAVRRAERYLGLVLLAGASSAAGAQEIETQVLVSAGGSVETNPYNELNTGGESIAVTAEIRPMARWRGEFSTLDLAGLVSLRQFTKRYGLENNYGLDGSLVTRVSPTVTVNTAAGFSSSQGGYNNFARRGLQLGAPTVEPLPGEVPVFLPIDPTVLGIQQRTNSFNVSAGASAAINTYSSLSLSVSGRALRFGATGFGDYNNVSGQASYSHQLSEATSIGASASVSRSDYRGRRFGDSLTNSFQGTFNHRLGSSWTLAGAAGIALTRSDQLVGMPKNKFNSLTGNVSFCQQAERSRFCLNLSRSPEPSGAGNVRVTNVIQSDYSLRVSERENLTFTGSYARTGRGRGVVPLPGVDFYSGGIRYDNQIRSNLTFYTGANMSKINDDGGLSRRANFGVNAGIQYRFGAFQ